MATRKQVIDAWRAWDAEQPMTPEQQALLETDARGNRIIPDDARTKALSEHGHKPVTRKLLAELLDGQTEVIAEQLRAMRKRIAALEAEVRAGHARLTALEAAQEAQEAWDDADL